MLNLYTLVLDYTGGTYIFQIEGKSPYSAMINWIKTIDFKSVKAGNVNKSYILNQLRNLEEKPILLSGMKNVWCFTFLLNKKLALVNIIKTNRK